MSCVLHFIQKRAQIFPSLPFVICVLIEALSVVFDIPGQNQLQALAFLTSSLDAWTMFLYSSHITCLCFHLLHVFCLCLSFTRSSYSHFSCRKDLHRIDGIPPAYTDH